LATKFLKQGNEQLRKDAAVLGLPRLFFDMNAHDQREYIKKAFKQSCKTHPDKGGSEENFRKIIEARNRLNDKIGIDGCISVKDVYNIYLTRKKIAPEEFVEGKYRLHYKMDVVENGTIRNKKTSKTVYLDKIVHINFQDVTFHMFKDESSNFGDVWCVIYQRNVFVHDEKLYYLLELEISRNDIVDRTIEIYGQLIRFESDVIKAHDRIVYLSDKRELVIRIMPVITL
jgi:hypothetical protein